MNFLHFGTSGNYPKLTFFHPSTLPDDGTLKKYPFFSPPRKLPPRNLEISPPRNRVFSPQPGNYPNLTFFHPPNSPLGNYPKLPKTTQNYPNLTFFHLFRQECKSGGVSAPGIPNLAVFLKKTLTLYVRPLFPWEFS
jgi:hypothetical protein